MHVLFWEEPPVDWWVPCLGGETELKESHLWFSPILSLSNNPIIKGETNRAQNQAMLGQSCPSNSHSLSGIILSIERNRAKRKNMAQNQAIHAMLDHSCLFDYLRKNSFKEKEKPNNIELGVMLLRSGKSWKKLPKVEKSWQKISSPHIRNMNQSLPKTGIFWLIFVLFLNQSYIKLLRSGRLWLKLFWMELDETGI